MQKNDALGLHISTALVEFFTCPKKPTYRLEKSHEEAISACGCSSYDGRPDRLQLLQQSATRPGRGSPGDLRHVPRSLCYGRSALRRSVRRAGDHGNAWSDWTVVGSGRLLSRRDRCRLRNLKQDKPTASGNAILIMAARGGCFLRLR